MAISSYKSFLMHKSGSDSSEYAKLVDIKDFPILGGEKEALETSTLSDKAQTYIEGIQKTDPMKFTCNYTQEDFSKVRALEGIEGYYAVWLGGTEETNGAVTPTGEHGKFSFKGIPSVYVNGAGTNEVIGMTVTIMPTTQIVAETAS